MNAGLRIDADTLRGTRYGVPNLLRFLAGHNIKASFFFSVGPDNMGRHIWRLLRPSFLFKMLRSKASSLYGWDILLKGILWPGPVIAKKAGLTMRSALEAGHEIGLHAWDHHAWQSHIDDMEDDAVYRSIKQGFETLSKTIGSSPVSSAAPGWRCSDSALLAKSGFPFRYNSDCRGEDIFSPVVDGRVMSQPQIPVTLPTYDEVIGHNGISDRNYNEYIISLFKPERLNILTIHAEVEGLACLDMFDLFLKTARSKGISFMPLGAFLTDDLKIKHSAIIKKTIHGREGWVSYQSKLERRIS
jgi:undecaprenyl phosphate-alpha-L-ara4FN deformylase